MWAEVGAKYMDKSHEGLKHTDVQLQQNQYKVGFYPSGDWLENEQKKDTPPDFEYQLIPIPAKPGGEDGGGGAARQAGEGYMVPAKGKNTAGGLEYARLMLSLEGAKGFTNLVKSPTVVVGGAEGITFPPGVTSSQAALKAAGSDVFNIRFDGLVPGPRHRGSRGHQRADVRPHQGRRVRRADPEEGGRHQEGLVRHQVQGLNRPSSQERKHGAY